MHTDRQQMTGSSWGAGMRRRGQVLVILLGLLGCWQMGHAADFTCSTAGDSGVACLIAAITTANANGKTNTLTLAAGIYTLTAINNGTASDSNGLPVITSTLTIMGAGAATTSIERAASAPAFRLLKVAATGVLTLQGLALRGGNSPGGAGGGIANSQGGTATLTDCLLTGNTAFQGGGISNSSTATLTDCLLTGNTANADTGGGILNLLFSTLTLTNSTLAYNTAHGGNGGGGITNYGTATLTNSTVAHNVGSILGGGITNGYPARLRYPDAYQQYRGIQHGRCFQRRGHL